MAMALHLPIAARPCTLRGDGDSVAVRASDRTGWCPSRAKQGQGQRLTTEPQQIFGIHMQFPTEIFSRRGSVVRSAETASGSVDVATTTAGAITEVDKDTFWPLVKDAGEKVVVLDMFTQWCGPCKLMLPKVTKLAESYGGDVVFAKLDCNQENKPLAKELGVKSVPTFKIFKNAEQVGEVRGAKYDELVNAIETARSSSSSSSA